MSLVPRAMFEEARRVTIPLHVLLQWDDEGTMGGHTGVPQFAGDAAAQFLTRHLKVTPGRQATSRR